MSQPLPPLAEPHGCKRGSDAGVQQRTDPRLVRATALALTPSSTLPCFLLYASLHLTPLHTRLVRSIIALARPSYCILMYRSPALLTSFQGPR